jgi:hypothetical protein
MLRKIGTRGLGEIAPTTLPDQYRADMANSQEFRVVPTGFTLYSTGMGGTSSQTMICSYCGTSPCPGTFAGLQAFYASSSQTCDPRDTVIDSAYQRGKSIDAAEPIKSGSARIAYSTHQSQSGTTTEVCV